MGRLPFCFVGLSFLVVGEVLTASATAQPLATEVQKHDEDKEALEKFLKDFKEPLRIRESKPVSVKDAQFVDSKGERWRGREEIEKESRRLFIAYTKENITSLLESFDAGPGHTFVASVRWENVVVEGELTKSIQRMTVILGQESEAWVVFFLHVTPVAVL